ncbi:MAG TPA: glutamyl-tRNA reductase [Steroidobacteraceae bacterium]|nr:glutamyl-tRNA reductase [Steroidobacteraceae bacterium]
MPFLVIGINHRTAPVEIREKIVFGGPELPTALRELSRIAGVREGAILSTCNRTELYCYTDETDPPLVPWLLQWHKVDPHELEGCVYQYKGPAAVQHAFAVASGLDSMILGEPQILGQLKDAYRAALQERCTGPLLNRLFQASFSVAKRIRTETRIGANAVSVASAAVNLAHTVFDNFAQHTALLIGAGDTIALAARHLRSQGLQRMIVANRTLERAQELAREFDGYAITLDTLATHLPEADIVVSSTASPVPVLTRAVVREALRVRKRRPMFMVDIAVPRDIEASVAELEDIYLFTIDDLERVVSTNLQARRHAAHDAEHLLANAVDHFQQRLRTLDAAPTIRHLRDEGERVRVQTLQQAQRMLASGREPQVVLEFLASTLTNRLLHSPSQRLRDAAAQRDAELIAAARVLFGLNDDSGKNSDLSSQLSTDPLNEADGG